MPRDDRIDIEDALGDVVLFCHDRCKECGHACELSVEPDKVVAALDRAGFKIVREEPVMGTKNQPGQFDCYANAEPDEPHFTLVARDASAPELVRDWARRRQEAIDLGLKPAGDRAQVLEALQLAAAMEHWRRRHRP